MTTEANSAPTSTEAQKPATPAIDIDAITAKATEAATKAAEKVAEDRAKTIAADNMKKLGNALAGNDVVEKSSNEKLLEKFVENPANFVQSIVGLTKKQIKEEQDEVNSYRQTESRVMTPLYNEYPELNSTAKLKLVDSITRDYLSKGDSYEVALEKAAQDTIKEFNLKSVSEAEREAGYSSGGLPQGGSYRPQAAQFDDSKSSTDFISGMRNRGTAFRTRK